MSAWTEHVDRWQDCDKCPLCRQRDRICLARGTVPCDVLFIGEAPGSSEDALGLPFKGPAGGLLDAMIASALSGPLQQEVRFAMTNLVACFPAEAKARGDNEPEESEILACRPRLVEFVNVVQPRLIVCVGSLATQYVDHEDTVKCVDIVHPAHILAHMPRAKKQMAIQKTIVVIRGAVYRMLDEERKPFEEWGKDNASLTKGRGLRQRYDAWTQDHADIEIPF